MSHAQPEGEPGQERRLTAEDDLQRLLLEGVSLQNLPPSAAPAAPSSERMQAAEEEAHESPTDGDEATETTEARPGRTGGDLQGALALFAEAAQDLATAGLELNLGRHFACVDYCNQVAEKAAQAVSLLLFGRRAPYNHDLRALGERVGAPAEIVSDMAALTPFHPEAFYAETPPEEADEVISAEAAGDYVQRARRILRWARGLIFKSV
jgi:HEPN domain-containing protein